MLKIIKIILLKNDKFIYIKLLSKFKNKLFSFELNILLICIYLL